MQSTTTAAASPQIHPLQLSTMRWNLGINWSAVRLPFLNPPLAQFEEEFGLKPARPRVQFQQNDDNNKVHGM